MRSLGPPSGQVESPPLAKGSIQVKVHCTHTVLPQCYMWRKRYSSFFYSTITLFNVSSLPYGTIVPSWVSPDVGCNVGSLVGESVSSCVGSWDGSSMGKEDGSNVGGSLGCKVGGSVGAGVGSIVGDSVGISVGTSVGGSVGAGVGSIVGDSVGR